MAKGDMPMRQRAAKSTNMMSTTWQQSRGITGLETAIVLIAFVVVSSVFAFAALSTGLFSADKAKETINAGLSEARSTVEIRGSIIARALTGDEVVATYTGDGAITVLPPLSKLPVVPESDKVTLKPAQTALTRVTTAPASGEYSINHATGVITLGDALAVGDSIQAEYSAGVVDELLFHVSNAAGGEAVNMKPGDVIFTYFDEFQFTSITTGDFTGNFLLEPGEIHSWSIYNLKNLNPQLKADTAFTIEIKPPRGAVVHIERRTPIELEKFNNLG